MLKRLAVIGQRGEPSLRLIECLLGVADLGSRLPHGSRFGVSLFTGASDRGLSHLLSPPKIPHDPRDPLPVGRQRPVFSGRLRKLALEPLQQIRR